MKQAAKGHLVCILLFNALFLNSASAQLDTIPLNDDKAFLINSKVLNEQRSIWVHLPENYHSTTQTYPVLYLLDGEGHFKYVSGLVDYLSSHDRNRIPEMIVVAILNVDRTRDFTPIHSLVFGGKVDSTRMATTGGGAKFLQFIKTEVIPLIDSNYRGQPYRILAAHSLGGTFGVYAKETAPDLFQSTILMSPAIYGGNSELLHRFGGFLQNHQKLSGKIFLSIGNEDTQTVDTLTRQLKRSAPKSMDWRFQQYKDENHFSVTYKSMYDALKFIYRDWFIDNYASSMLSWKDIRLHFDKLSNEFGYPILPPEDLLNTAGYKQFNAGNIDAAIEIFQQNTINFPNSWNAFDSMGEAYAKKGDKRLAILNYERSVELNPGNENGKETLKQLRK